MSKFSNGHGNVSEMKDLLYYFSSSSINLLQNSLKKISLELSIILLQNFAENNIYVCL